MRLGFSIIFLTFCYTLSSQNNLDFVNISVSDETKTQEITGGFGSELAKKVSFVNFNGFITNEFFIPKEGPTTFDNHYFNLFFSSQLNDNIFIEAQLEYEHAGKDIDLRYAYADYKFSNAFVIRTGKFLVPAGVFNEYKYPEYISKTVSRAWVNREITPSAWAEVGIQLRGTVKLNNINPYYSIYAVNGLHGEPGVDIRSMRGNDRDSKGGNTNKALGGALGLRNSRLNAALNYYSGKYTADNVLNLEIYGASFYYTASKYSIWSELHKAAQDNYTTDGEIITNDKLGFYLQAGLFVFPKLESIIRYDQIDFEQEGANNRKRWTFGLNYHLSQTAVCKVNYEIINTDLDSDTDELIGFQLAIGF
ncbi:hypothetical protein [Carboxylicivirga sp. M1479]|uniref:hypothetical protein n=1 Tax=Carboxylicivirga sp. M1479 TaxID=2594476 RepID=UPI001178C1E2|nr:hypothetical protein [Carboxylicivirga sp. M1479]TRX60302.1 hypothetical protein FNN09_20755 [Carboxylicivirga sp. M1479]